MTDIQTKRDEILNVARSLFYRHGYRNTPVSAILESAGIAKGTFYHHFKSKEDVLDKLVDRSFEGILPTLHEIATDSRQDPLTRLREVFRASSEWKAENAGLLVEMVEVLFADDNLLLRSKHFKKWRELVDPIISSLVREGVETGVLDTPYPDRAGEIALRVAQSMSDSMAEILLSLDEHPENMKRLRELVEAFQSAMERIIGAPDGSLELVHPALFEALEREVRRKGRKHGSRT